MSDAALLVIAIAAGVAAGFINTLAGSGSFLTLPALIWLGLPPQVANATNRIGILLGSCVALRAFPKDFRLPRADLGRLFVPSVLGAVAGAMLAARLDPRAMDVAVGLLMLAMLLLIVAQPGRLLPPADVPPTTRGRATFPVFFAIGVYGGFIQAGVGVFLLLALVQVVRLPPHRANPVKLLLVLVFTVPAFLVFVIEGQVRFGIGLVLAAGQCVGALMAARFSRDAVRANVWIRRILIVVLGATAWKLLT